MRTVQILGTGCPKCKKLAELAAQAIEQTADEKFKLEKITDINEIIKFGVMTTPALAVDGQVKIVGKLATVDEIKQAIGQ